jgi:hypothetical protein
LVSIRLAVRNGLFLVQAAIDREADRVDPRQRLVAAVPDEVREGIDHGGVGRAAQGVEEGVVV